MGTIMERDEDFVDEIIRARAAVNPGFPAMVEAALERLRARRARRENGDDPSLHGEAAEAGR